MPPEDQGSKRPLLKEKEDKTLDNVSVSFFYKALMSFHKFYQSCPLLRRIHTLSNFLVISFDLDLQCVS